jgi:HAD superfamily hydrolase (TIGR01509 family)
MARVLALGTVKCFFVIGLGEASGMKVEPSPAIDLIIFDSDGVLVDSETIGIEVLVNAAREVGADIGFEEALSLFRGAKMADCIQDIERRAGRKLGDAFVETIRVDTAEAFASRLRPVPGVRSALAAIKLPVCVASNGPRAKLTQALRLTRLHRRFGDHVYSAYEVGAWKPDPGLFLYAAKQFQADPGRCLVVEDSLPGVRAAKAAGMRVFGYAGGDRSMAPALAGAGAEVFYDMLKLPSLVRT